MSERKRFFLLILIMTIVSLIVGGIAIFMLYNTAMGETRERLVETAQSQARLIEAVARFDAIYSRDYPEGATSATISQVIDAHKHYRGFGQTGEFTLAKRNGNDIVFLLSHRHYDLENLKPIPFDSHLGEPMRRALLKQSGTVIGLDYRGEVVLAAYEPVEELNLGIVAKIDLAEVRAPFIKAGSVGLVVAVFVVLIGVILFLRISNPIIERLKELSQQIIKAQESERERIAREIHDDLGQSLVTSKILIQSMDSEINSKDTSLKQTCKTVIEYHDSIIDKIHNISSALRPSTLREFGLTNAIKLMVDEFNQGNCTRIKLRSVELENLEFQEEPINLYRIIQEALTNIVKHAEASEVQITIKTKKEKLHVSIKDNGQGVSSMKSKQSKRNSGGLGLSTMEERAKILGGNFCITSRDGQGTIVQLNIPVKLRKKDNEQI